MQTLEYGKSSNGQETDIGKAWTLGTRIHVFLYKENSWYSSRHWRFAISDFLTPGPGCQFTKFDALICNDVTQLIRRLPPKRSALDPWSTWILKEYADDISPSLTKIVNLSMSCGSVYANLKEAYITLLLKKPTLDKSDINNYRPISNLSVLFKLLERAVCTHFVSYLNVNSLMPRHQSAYRWHYSTETALAFVFSELISALDDGNLALMALLALSAASDCIDHDILLSRLNITYGIGNMVHSWISSYQSGRTQSVQVDDVIWSASRVRCGAHRVFVIHRRFGHDRH